MLSRYMKKLLIMNLEQLRSPQYKNCAEKPLPLFCLFMNNLACVIHVEPCYPTHSKSTLRFLLSKFLLQVTNFINFSKYSHMQKFRTKDHGAGGRPIESLTTIHTNIPAIPINFYLKQYIYIPETKISTYHSNIFPTRTSN